MNARRINRLRCFLSNKFLSSLGANRIELPVFAVIDIILVFIVLTCKLNILKQLTTDLEKSLPFSFKIV